MTRHAPAATAQRGRLLSLWLVTRWPLFAAVIATAFGLGFIGFGLVLERQPSPTGATGLAYLALQLFTLQAGAVPEPVPWQLDVARFLAPASTATAIAVALARVFSEELEEVRLHFRTRHVVVCGLGARGARLVSSLLDAGYAVVAVEVDPHSPALREARRQGALVVVGDARTGEVLARAGVRRAACVVALAGADDTNAAVAIRAGELAPDRGPALTCLAHVKDPGLCALLRAEELTAGHSASFRLDFFNIYEQGARALLHDHPVDPAAAVGPRLAVIGLSALGQALVVEAARQWRAGPVPLVHRLGLTVIDPDAERIIALLQTRYPGLAQTADIQPVADVLDGPKDAAVARLGPWQAIFVCVDDDSSALAAAIQARQRLGDRSTPVVVDLSAASGLAGLLQRQARDAGVSAFDLFERTLRPELLLGGTYEVLARAIHAEYVEAQQRDGITPATNPAMVPWDALPDSLRESNRDQGAHIGVKLAAIGCGVAPLSDWDADLLTFADTDVEMLAELEHQRWTDQRVRDGWTPGPKDIAAKRSPYLIGWDQLADDVKELDRRAVRSIPAFLTRAGYQVIRVTPPRQA